MRAVRCLLRGLPLVLLVVALASPRAARAEFDEEEARFPNDAYPEDFRCLVGEAIDRAAHGLLRLQADDGSWGHPDGRSYPMGPTALVTLALLKAGVPPDHPRIERAFAYLRTLPMQKTYSVAVLLMALDAKYGGSLDPFEEEEVDRYGHRRERRPCEEQASKEDLRWMKDGVDFLVAHQHGGTWRYPDGDFDLSNTQYALLGLKAAERCGLEVPTKVWTSALEFLLDYQAADGEAVDVRANEVRGDYRIEWIEHAKARGFPYMHGMAVTGSMTTAGLAGLLICQDRLWESRRFTGRMRQRTREAIRDGFAWLQANFDVRRNPGFGRGHHYYYLYGLERAGILARMRFVGKHDWYQDGALVLLEAQEPDGLWFRGDVVQSAFALLFLKRATWRTCNPPITPPAHADGAGNGGGR